MPVPVNKKPVDRKTELLELMAKIISEADGIESNIGMTSPYWDYLREYRSLLNP
jgi:hypothetical protein